MKTMNFSPTHSLVNLSNSILKFYGVIPFHPTLPEVDEILNKNKEKNIVLILFDGMNDIIKKKHLKDYHFLQKQKQVMITSVFPPTTVAATTALLSAKYPIETGWLGWNQHFNDKDVTLDMFSSRISGTDQVYEGFSTNDIFKYENIISLINKQTPYHADSIYPTYINQGEAKSLRHFFSLIQKKSLNGNSHFTYAYWPSPDHEIHDFGTKSKKARRIIRFISRKCEKLERRCPNTLFIVVADHGLIDAKYDVLKEHPDLLSCLTCPPFLDSRAVMMNVYEEKREIFENLFTKYYREHYYLYKKSEYLTKNIFGYGEPHKNIQNCFGDYLAVSKDEHTLCLSSTPDLFKGCHAGSTDDEYLISIVFINKNLK